MEKPLPGVNPKGEITFAQKNWWLSLSMSSLCLRVTYTLWGSFRWVEGGRARDDLKKGAAGDADTSVPAPPLGTSKGLSLGHGPCGWWRRGKLCPWDHLESAVPTASCKASASLSPSYLQKSDLRR